mmetsp:Transcript_3530/g.8735  ORF Transcript_3530/g.8735 Transcript_3530/m.8735 type:complete len:601 (+) Transcript_3530:102-1904(+)
MCLECRALGALLAAGAADGVAVTLASVRALDFSPTVLEIEDKRLRDGAAEAYLAETLAALGEHFGVELVPVTVDSDGSCLPHAVSRCLVGKEVLFDVLRAALSRELRENRASYRPVLQQSMSDATFEEYWQGVCDEAAPTRGERTKRWLGPEHVLALCNILQRPILLLDTPEEMGRGDGRSGLFVPTRRDPSVSGDDDSARCPLVIGWANPDKDHFVSLVVPSRSDRLAAEDQQVADRVVRANPGLWETIELLLQERESNDTRTIQLSVPEGYSPGDVCVLRDNSTGEEFSATVPQGKQPGDSFEHKLPGPTAHRLMRLRRSLVHFYAQTAPAVRLQTFALLHKVLSNLADAILMGDDERVSKVGQLFLDNRLVAAQVVARRGALDILLAAGFRKAEDGAEARPRVYFDDGVPAREALLAARDALALLRHDEGVALGGGQVPAARQAEAFGPRPAYLGGWECLAEQQAKHWLFGLGDARRRVAKGDLEAALTKLRATFAQVAEQHGAAELAGLFGDVDPVEYHRLLAALRCPRCARVQPPPAEACEDCNFELVSDKHSGHARVLEVAAEAARKAAGETLGSSEPTSESSVPPPVPPETRA